MTASIKAMLINQTDGQTTINTHRVSAISLKIAERHDNLHFKTCYRDAMLIIPNLPMHHH